MQNPWGVLPKRDTGSPDYNSIFVQVGSALTAWETAESHAAELFDAMVAAQPSNRAAFSAFISVIASSARTELLSAAFSSAIEKSDPAFEDISSIIDRFSKLGARRNEIAHGRVYDLGEFGYYLGPNNTMRHKWGIIPFGHVA